ncbi:MAG TPA: LamG domain-containing protein [Kiritimatiellia bacterium]|nr:LamG domain-containing protein [Kiritimatiellia bacterium]HMP34051.1 LamG domain-containing protein [Kiritimatiellia bacterium]
MNTFRSLMAFAFLVMAPVVKSEETGEPVYLSFIRQSRPVAHYRLNDSTSEAMRNLYAGAEGGGTPARLVHGDDPVARVPSMTPHEFVGTNRINGFDFDNTGLRFSHSLSRINSAVIVSGVGLPDFAEPHADELSLSVWVKAAPEQVDRAGLVSRKSGDLLDSYQVALSVWGGCYDIVMNDGDGSFRSFYTSSRPNGAWQHLVVVFDSKGWFEESAGMLRFYVNGERVFTGRTGNHTRAQLAPSRENLIIGGIAYQQRDQDGLNNGFNGIIDELTLWDRALSDEDVRELYASAIIGRRPMVIIIGSSSAVRPVATPY